MALLVVALLNLGLVACGSGSEQQSARIDTSAVSPPAKGDLAKLTWAVNGEPTTLDPIYAYNFFDGQILANMCETLFRLNADLTTSPSLATRARNPSSKRWVYDIRKGVKFWDGTPLTAEDVVYSLRRNLDDDLGSYFVDYYRWVKDIRATGSHQVTVDLKQPDPIWNQVLVVAGSAVMKKGWAVQQGESLGRPKSGLMCTGPYELASWKRGGSITLKPNPQYWDSSAKPRAATIDFRFLEDPAAQTQALVSGGVDGMFLVDPSGLPRLRASNGQLYFGRNLMVNYLSPTEVQSPLKDVRVRKALALLVDRDAIAKTVYNGAAQPMQTMVTPTIWGNDPEVRKVYKANWDAAAIYARPDVDQARKLFQEAGAPKETMTLAYPTGGAEQQIAEAVQSSARQIGMRIKLKGYTATGMVNLYYDKKAQRSAGIDLMYSPFNVDATEPLILYAVFLPSLESVYNYSGYSNAQVTRLLEQASMTYDPVKRARLTAGAEKLVMGAMPIIPLVSPNVMAYMNNRVSGSPTSYSIYWSSWANHVGAAGAR